MTGVCGVRGVLVVSGTGTEIGKTVTTAAVAACALRAGHSVAVLKPAQTGVGGDEPGDVARVRRLTGAGGRPGTSVTGVELARYPEPLAPATAAGRAGRPCVRLEQIAEAAEKLAMTHDLVLVEGAGGLLVRFDEAGATLADAARLLAAPVLVVTEPGLGTLNVTELTAEALRARRIDCAGMVIGRMPATPDLATRCNVTDLPQTSGLPVVGAIPDGAGSLAPDGFRSAAPGWLAPELGGVWQGPQALAGSMTGGSRG
ncbi:dethiobiotin synthase [Streptomyces sp. NBC_01795]|uniref:dethiobiotin synthase n=1 Tax=unclassified Streptomyces TaxID=2593676 RepID=UPI002DDBDDA8|nr:MULTISPECIES: dethiobiotin synthase [unclassified Streptomyces]WSA96775.1 dethiobiotin synthase [Streptomyces sp. NBC_01795]WSS10600.1 dethiobiotin synthase [Streptomyces sp. NBC_01186]